MPLDVNQTVFGNELCRWLKETQKGQKPVSKAGLRMKLKHAGGPHSPHALIIAVLLSPITSHQSQFAQWSGGGKSYQDLIKYVSS